MDLSLYLNAINHNKDPLMDGESELMERDYVPFVVNRCLSYFPDTIFFANEMNCSHQLPNKMQFDFLRLGIRKKKRYSSWLKKQKLDRIEIIKEYFGYSNERALEISDLISDDDLESMQEQMFKGGTQKPKKTK